MKVQYRKNERKTVPQLFEEAARKYGKKTLYVYRDSSGNKCEITYEQYYQDVAEFSAGLKVMNLAGKKLLIISDNCVQLSETVLASMCLGGIDVEKENTFPNQELAKIAGIIKPEVICLQNRTSYEKFLLLRIDWPVSIIFYHTEGITLPENATDFRNVCNMGKKGLASGEFSLSEQIQQTKADQPVTIVFTSGTTGTPKGCLLTNGNLTYGVTEFAGNIYLDDTETYLSIIHIRHIGEKLAIFMGLTNGYRIVLSSVPEMRSDMIAERPHVIASSPVMYKTIKDTIVQKFGETGKIGVFNFFRKRSFRFIQARRILTGTVAHEKKPSPAKKISACISFVAYAPWHCLGNLLVYRKIRTMTGGRIRVAISAGAMLANDIDDFFETIGYKMINGYGTNETTAVITVRDMKHNVRHSIGAMAPGTEYRIIDSETGEPCPFGRAGVLQVKGKQVFRGYFNNPEATKVVLSDDGWYNTGDLVREGLDGQFVYIGRETNTISLLDRNNVEPEPMEKKLESSSCIKSAVVIGQSRAFLTALIFPHKENLSLSLDIEKPDLGASAARAFFKKEIDSCINLENGFQTHELIQDFQLIDDELKPGDLLTPTMKKRRKLFLERYAEQIEEMYHRTVIETVKL
ncbi:MAG: AMP-binding protein [Spirochaetales bacterium]|nr:AMP-binding protein [Spirochaetales bacterium]